MSSHVLIKGNIKDLVHVCVHTVRRSPGLLDVHAHDPLRRNASFADDTELESEHHTHLFPAASLSQ